MSAVQSSAMQIDTTSINPSTLQSRESRRDGLRQVGFSPFPRVSLDAGQTLGLLINESDSGFCMIASDREEVGDLLRVMVRGLHGHTSRDVVARVVWSEATDAGRCRMGLKLLRENQPQMVRMRYESEHALDRFATNRG
ncbi:MAG TPA: PilZ domain-containing protein [Myxococcales bacterium]|nr:PilZ domain-containing protein [Myxococcales bacterium]